VGLWRWLFGLARNRGVVVGDGRFDLRIVGTAFHQATLDRLGGRRSSDGFHRRCAALLARDPNNAHDRRAVAVIIHGEPVGHLDREQARDFLVALEHAGFADAACEAEIVGGWLRNADDWGYVGVRLNACLPFKLIAADRYEKTQPKSARQKDHQAKGEASRQAAPIRSSQQRIGRG